MNYNMRIINSLLFRISKVLTRKYSLSQKGDFIASLNHFVALNESAENKVLLFQRYYNIGMRSFPLVSLEERLRFYGWFSLIEKISSVEGEIVEAGVGYGNTLITLATANTHFKINKKIYAFDSFQGFPIPHENDLGSRVETLKKVSGWSDASILTIQNMIKTHQVENSVPLDEGAIIYKKGFFENTMPAELPENISLLHIDCDLYEGVKHVLESTYSHLTENAIVIIDEYIDSKWPGAKIATEELLKGKSISIQTFPSLNRFGFIKK